MEKLKHRAFREDCEVDLMFFFNLMLLKGLKQKVAEFSEKATQHLNIISLMEKRNVLEEIIKQVKSRWSNFVNSIEFRSKLLLGASNFYKCLSLVCFC